MCQAPVSNLKPVDNADDDDKDENHDDDAEENKFNLKDDKSETIREETASFDLLGDLTKTKMKK